ncbi:hypothetical protein CPC16_000154 [Podila verticillata]|nr:hypothetical protein CPC16_000154 [Podila verticillata]
MKDQQLFERPQLQYHSFDYMHNHDHGHDSDDFHEVNHLKGWDEIMTHVRLEGRDDDDNALDSIGDSNVRPFSPGPWSGKTLTHGHYHGKLPHKKDGVKADCGPGVTRSNTIKRAMQDANGCRGNGVHKAEYAGPDVLAGSNRLGEELTNQAAILHVDDKDGGIGYSDQRLFSPEKLAEEHKSGFDDQWETKGEAMTRHKSGLFNNNNNNNNINNSTTTNSAPKPKKEALLARMLTHLQSPRPSRNKSLIQEILKGPSSRGRVEHATSEEEQIHAMELGQRKMTLGKTRRNGFKHHDHHRSSPSSSVQLPRRATVDTPAYAISDTPFYGIENVEISSARYQELRARRNDDGDSAERLSNEGENSQNLGGKGKDLSDHDKLRKHREHIWAIAHEHEYGLVVNNSEANGAPSAFEQGRYKRFSRLVPIPTDSSSPPTPLSSKSRFNPKAQATVLGPQEEEDPSLDVDGCVCTPIPPEDQICIVENTIESPPPNHTPALAPAPTLPASQGNYGPDSFAESLQGSTVGQSQQEQERTKYRRRACLTKWKEWLFVVMALAIVVVIVMVLVLPKNGRGGDDGAPGGDDMYLEKGHDAHDDGKQEITTKSGGATKLTATTKVATTVATAAGDATTTAIAEKLDPSSAPTETPTATKMTSSSASFSATLTTSANQ